MHVMLDLETFGTGPDAAIVQIAAGAFELGFDRKPDPEISPYNAYINPSAVDGRITASTVMFWMSQSDEARIKLITGMESGGTLFDALSGLCLWFANNKIEAEGVWSFGATFDIVILNQILQRHGFRVPWSYRSERCLRTAAAIFDKDREHYPQTGLLHDAADDVKNQIAWLQRIHP